MREVNVILKRKSNKNLYPKLQAWRTNNRLGLWDDEEIRGSTSLVLLGNFVGEIDSSKKVSGRPNLQLHRIALVHLRNRHRHKYLQCHRFYRR